MGPGQNLVSGHQISVYEESESPGDRSFAHDVAGDANQSTLIAATPEAEAEFGLGADAARLPVYSTRPAAPSAGKASTALRGAVSPAPPPPPLGSPASPGGIPDGMALRRTIEPGCATLLEPGDDRDNSAADFAAYSPVHGRTRSARPSTPARHRPRRVAAAPTRKRPRRCRQKATPDPDSQRPGPLDP